MVMLHIRQAPASDLPCLHEPDLFFAESPADIAQAKELCGRCPFREPCLAGALDRGEPWGVWGGELVLGGTIVASKRGRGRPRGSTARRASPTGSAA